MALNRYMHPRNIYRKPPDFSYLAKVFPEFANVAKIDMAGKVTVDFKDPVALRALTKCLLKKDFKLDVEIPADRLVPTLPLRLNYILWIEDLMNLVNKNNGINGLDIGTGACAVYPLLAAVHCKWSMLGTESDEESLAKAKKNVAVNNLKDHVTLLHNPTKTIVEHILSSNVDKVYDFCMCNPPFYSNVQELCESRSTARPPPKNAFTGSPQELITEGGELEFIRTLISESKAFKDRILIYTTMVGHKYNLKVLLEDLKCEGIHHTHTEFCQGRVTRWGLAWTYQDYDMTKIEPSRDKPQKKTAPITSLLPPISNETYDVQTVVSKLRNLLKNLNIVHKIVCKRGTCFIFDVVAKENTWSNQRRKRRHQKRLDAGEVKKCKLGQNEEQVIEHVGVTDDRKHGKETTVTDGGHDDIESISNGGKSDQATVSDNAEKVVMVHAYLKVFKKINDIMFEMEFLDGFGGKEALHQIVQYIKNNWK